MVEKEGKLGDFEKKIGQKTTKTHPKADPDSGPTPCSGGWSCWGHQKRRGAAEGSSFLVYPKLR